MKIAILIFSLVTLNLFGVRAGYLTESDNSAAGRYAGLYDDDLQQGKITGTVKDAGGNPLAGVTVLVKGPSIGAVTDAAGKYSLSSVPQNAVLVFSFIGMTTQEIPFQGRTVIDVSMKEEAIGLDEVVVVGYGTTKKTNLTGAVSTATADVIESRPVTNLGQGLQGAIPNLNITQTTGTLGASSDFNIRGFESINGGDPLILVNGVPMNVNRLNPNDIESVTVLKDAASAAIYGARAAYGVILITTKSGMKSQKPQVNLSMNYGINTPTVKFRAEDAMQRATYMNLASQRSNGNNYYQFTEEVMPNLIAHYNDPTKPSAFIQASNPTLWMACGNTDWADILMRDYYPQQQYNASVQGGGDTYDYYASISYFNQEGMNKIFDENYDRYNIMTNINFDVTKWAKVGVQLAVNNSYKYYPPNNSAGHHDEYSSPYQYHQWANWPVYAPNGKYFSGGSVPNMVQFYNDAGYRDRTINDYWMTVNGVLKPVKDLTINMDYSNNIVNQDETSYWRRLEMYYVDGNVSGYFPYTNPSQVTKYYYNTKYYAFNIYGTYEKKLGDHNLKLMAGFNQENQKYKYFNAKRDKLMVESMPYMSLAYGVQTVGDGASEYAIRGAFTRFNYDYAGRYLFEFNGRYDGTSKFPKNDRFAFFPSASIGWRLDNEPYLAGLKGKFDLLKIRASYGSLGNQAVTGTYPYLATYSSGQVSYLLENEMPMTLYAPGLVSPTLTWETVVQQDIGIDIAMFNSRFNFTFDYYRRDTKDMLTRSQTLPAVLAVSEPNTNAADSKTLGWDMSAEWRQASGQVNWGVKVILSDYQATITKFSNPTGLISDYYVGQKLGSIWGLVTDRIAQTDEEARSIDQKNISGRTRYAGDLLFKDLNGDGKITYGAGTLADPGDRMVIGNNTPRYSFGVNTDVKWKGFDLGVFFQGIGKRDYWINGRYWLNGWNDEWTAHGRVIMEDYWTPDNPDAYFPFPIITGGSDVTATQTRYLQDVAYVRLKELTLGYTLPKSITDRVKLEKVRVYVSGNNVLEMSNIYKQKELADPEMTTTYQTPINRTYSFGLNVSF